MPPADSLAGSPWALGGGPDTAELRAVPQPWERHRSHSAKQPTAGWAHRGPAGLSLKMAAPATLRPLSGRISAEY